MATRRRGLISEHETEQLLGDIARRRDRGQSDRDIALAITAKIGVRVLSDPKGIGVLLESLGKAMQRTADTQTTAPPSPSEDVLDLSAFRMRKKNDD
ncbi:hypothetical protein LCGC14_1058660 [marine sediment metagenome]|uniref:Uncharacterized protein n=1 Tax=marine sediment metagenome TaxID=412755 RepID=A0A0F9N8M9_9ZZZZ